MKNSVVLIGVGEMGGVFARGALRMEHPVYPVGRGTDMAAVAKSVPDPEAVIVSVGEKDLDAALKAVPRVWHDRLVLLQNELLPRNWQAHGLKNPTVISVWFEKKPGQDFKVIIPSPVYGPKAKWVESILGTLGIPCRVCKDEQDLLFELVVKNLYILTTNIAGLKVGGNVGGLWNQHHEEAVAVADDVLDIQFQLIDQQLDRSKLIQAMAAAFDGDREHKCMGRSAPARLERALQQAKEFGLDVSALKDIAESREG